VIISRTSAHPSESSLPAMIGEAATDIREPLTSEGEKGTTGGYIMCGDRDRGAGVSEGACPPILEIGKMQDLGTGSEEVQVWSYRPNIPFNSLPGDSPSFFSVDCSPSPLDSSPDDVPRPPISMSGSMDVDFRLTFTVQTGSFGLGG